MERTVGIAFIAVLFGAFLWFAAPAFASAQWGWFSNEDAPAWLVKVYRISLVVAIAGIGIAVWSASTR